MRLATYSLLFTSLVAACATPVTEPEIGEIDQDIWGQTPGAHATTKQVAWEQLSPTNLYGYGLTSLTSYAANGVPSTTLRAFYRDATGSGCLHGLYNVDGGSWFTDSTLTLCGSPTFNGGVSATAWSSTRHDLFWFRFAFGSNARLMHAYYDGSAWHEEDLGVTTTQALGVPVAGSWATGHLDIIWRDANGQLRRRAFDRGRKGVAGYTSTGWQIGDVSIATGIPDAQLSVAEPTTNEIDIGYRATNGALTILQTKNDSTWTTITPGYTIDSAPALASWGGGHLMAIANAGGQLRQVNRVDSLWSSSVFPTERPFDRPLAVASTSRARRVDLFATDPGTGSLIHSLFQESLPGFAELSNPQPDFWCWANAAGAAINYLNLGRPGWTPAQTCEYVGIDDGTYCCGLNPPDSCLHGGSSQDVFADFGIGWNNDDILTLSQVRYQIQSRHQPVLVREDHNTTSGGHIVVLRDTYRLGGVDYVELADPANNGKTWVWSWTKLITYDGNWNVDYMLSDFYFE